MTVENKVVLVTGGAAGIGAGISRHLLSQVAKVVVVDLDSDRGTALEREFPDHLVFVHGDVSDPAVADSAVQVAVDAFGRLHALVNNAHVSRQKPFLEHTPDDWDLSFRTGFEATRNFMLAAHDQLRQHRGAVVNFASGAGIAGMPMQASYGAAKEAIRGLSRVVAREWALDGIRVNVVSPIALTEGVQHWADQFPDQFEAMVGRIPLGRAGDPQHDIAPVVEFLISDAAQYVTGQTLMADGGSIMLH
ncbi:SDR family NAD(P)-dependent oxidoreductase [Jongsikchunia kroppenstedtii]|uniref:SDR family NAD(P)-dependent oxidoreductase n=1 Tax=Jongsikchunia kroppenstedtii TaxID=1121721 RepID=UPI0003645654|nr:SDR family oxidoreductase [Jongsikchunia kroppenstedtii]